MSVNHTPYKTKSVKLVVIIKSWIVDGIYNCSITGSVPVQIDYSFSLLVYLIGYLVLIHHTNKCFSWPLCTDRL